MSRPPDEFVAHCLELLSPLGAARARRMFGGHGLYVDELFVALVILDRLYLKVDAITRARFEAAGCTPFVYDGHDKPVTVSYLTALEDAMESPTQMQPWARLAVDAALRARVSKPAPARRKAKASTPAAAATTRKTAAPARRAKPAKRGT